MNLSDRAIYRSFENSGGEPRNISISGLPLTESRRLCADPTALLAWYPALCGRLLTDPSNNELPYLPLAADTVSVRVERRLDPYQSDDALHALRGAMRAILGAASTCMLHVCGWQPKGVVCLAPADYADVAATNLLADLKLSELGPEFWQEPQPTLRVWDAARSECAGELPSLEHSGLANPMGVAGAACTVDGKLVLTHRSRRVSTYADLLGPAASGYVEWADVQNCPADSLDAILQAALRREITEELRLSGDEICEMTPLGFYRELYRAGLCQGFYAFRTSLTADELFERAAIAQDRGEFAGMVFISAHERSLRKLLSGEITDIPSAGLEAMGLLSALLRKGLPNDA